MLPEGSPAWIQHALWSNGLLAVSWAPLGSAWALGQSWPVTASTLRVGAAITGRCAGRPWTADDYLTPVDGGLVLVRSLDEHGRPFGGGREVSAVAPWEVSIAVKNALDVALSEAADRLRV